MSKISDFYDQLNNLLSSKFGTTHKKLTDPYLPEENDELVLKRGYGFFVSGGSNPNLTADCFLSQTREITIRLTVKNYGTERDISIRENSEKTLLEDHINLVSAVLKDSNLNETLAKIEYVSDNGIEYIYSDYGNFLVINSTYQIQYVENI